MKYFIVSFYIVLIIVSFIGIKWSNQMMERASIKDAENSIYPDSVLICFFMYFSDFLFVFLISSVMSLIMFLGLRFFKLIEEAEIKKYLWINLLGVISNAILFIPLQELL